MICVELSGRFVLAFEPFFKHAVVVFVRLVAAVAGKEAVGQAVCDMALFNAVVAHYAVKTAPLG